MISVGPIAMLPYWPISSLISAMAMAMAMDTINTMVYQGNEHEVGTIKPCPGLRETKQTLHSWAHCWVRASSPKICATRRAPYRGGLEYMGRTMRLICDVTRAAWGKNETANQSGRKGKLSEFANQSRAVTCLVYDAWCTIKHQSPKLTTK